MTDQITDQQIAASAQHLARFLVTVLDILALERTIEFLRRDTWDVGRRQLLKTAARQEQRTFKRVFARFIRRAQYRHLPVAAEPFFIAVRTGQVSPSAAVEILTSLLDAASYKSRSTVAEDGGV